MDEVDSSEPVAPSRQRSRPSSGLSVCCLTSDPPLRVARILAILRDVADEIVVAVDSRVDPAELAPLFEVADVVVRFEYVDPPERARPWLMDLCRHDWILMIDGDEIPSNALLSLLPSFIQDDVAQCRIARRWCFPDETHWLRERPWWPDFQIRLVHQGPSVDFDLSVHGGVRADSHARLVEEPLYHLSCLVKSFGDRRRRLREYEALRPGMAAAGGGPLNDTLFAPEHFATLKPAAVPLDDVDNIRSVINAVSTTALRTFDLPVVSAAEVAEHVPKDGLEPQGYRASIRVVEVDRRAGPGGYTMVVVEVRNDGSMTLPWRDDRGVQLRVATRVIDHTRPEAADWTRTSLPCAIPVGEARIVEAIVRVPDQSGIYTLEVDMLNERSRWFGCVCHSELVVASRWGRYTLNNA